MLLPCCCVKSPQSPIAKGDSGGFIYPWVQQSVHGSVVLGEGGQVRSRHVGIATSRLRRGCSVETALDKVGGNEGLKANYLANYAFINHIYEYGTGAVA